MAIGLGGSAKKKLELARLDARENQAKALPSPISGKALVGPCGVAARVHKLIFKK